jgi:zinc protease
MFSTDLDLLGVLPDDVQVSTLENGLVVVVREDASAPVVSAQAWCRAGSVDEGRWLGAGLSHVLEHMLFKGTTTRGSGRIDQEVQDAGGYMNAYTSFDRTVYWINVPSTGARVAVDILCDILQHATLPEGELTKELDVIRREMDMCHDDPGRRSSRQLFETAYVRSPYRYPVIGIPGIFNGLKREDVVGYYREQYAPNNLFLVVVGQVNAGEVLEQVREAFAGTPARPVSRVPLLLEPRQTAPRVREEEAPIELAHLHTAWHIPELLHDDIPALDVLSIVLGAGRSSRLHREVREKKGWVHHAEAWTYNPGNPGLFGMSAVVEGDKFEASVSALLEQVRRLQDEAVAEEEVTKAIKQVRAATLGVRKTMQGQAQDLGGSWLAVGDLGFSARYLDAVGRVRPEHLQRVAKTYLGEAGRSLSALVPKGCRPSRVRVRTGVTAGAVQMVTLKNGLRLLVKEEGRLPFVEVRAAFRGGVLAETTADNGVTGLMTKLLLKGTSTRTAEQLAREIESVGGQLDTYAGNNSFGLTLEVMSDDFGLAMDLLTDVLRRPVFPAEELEREREFQLAAIRAQKDQLLQRAGRAMRRAMFGERGYGLDVSGSEASVQALGQVQVASLHRRLTVPNNGILAVFGRVTMAEVRTAVEAALGSWEPGETGLVDPEVAVRPTEPVRVREVQDKRQTVLVMGFAGVTMHHPDRYALDLIQEACSDLGSRVFVRIRDQLGLAYYVGAQNFAGLGAGYFGFYAGTEPGKAEQVEAEFLAEVGQLRTDGLSAEELTRAKAKLIGQKKIARQDLGTLALTMALDELCGLGYRHQELEDTCYERVSAEDIVRVAREYLNPQSYVVARAGA